MREENQGFTLVELIAVILIIGALAAMALPRFVSFAADARVASVTSMAGALNTAANMVYAKCMVTPSCDTNGWFVGTIDGTYYQIVYGYPLAGNIYNGYIQDTVRYDGFTAVASGGGTTKFKLNNAKDPDSCAAIYRDALNPDYSRNPMSVTTITMGC